MRSERLAAVRRSLAGWDIDTLIVTGPTNYRWLSGFTGSNCTLVVTADHALLGTDFRYWEQAQQQAPTFELVKMGREAHWPTLADLLRQVEAGRIGLEADHVPVTTFNTWQGYQAQAGLEHIRFVPLVQPLAPLRVVKTEEELALIRRAAAITDAAMGEVNQLARPGMTEKELAWALEKHMRDSGADGVAFDIIVAAGPNGALAHHAPGSRPLQVGDGIVIDMGAKLDGYHSDLTRSFYLGSQPDNQFWAVYNLVLTAQKNALANMRAGMTGREIDDLAREVIADAGHGDHFGHSLGHGVGLNIHEEPSLSSRSSEAIPAGAVVTVEPGVYLPGWGGVRIEDLVLLGEDGPEFLSHCPKNPIIPVS